MQDPNLLKEALKKYHKENYYVQSWAEYQEELTKLVEKVVAYIKEHKISVDAVVPILRGGNVSGTVLAYALDALAILPVQYKYFFIDGMCQLRRIHEINKELVYRDDPMFVLVEGNYCYGNQAKYAAKDLKTAFPKCRIIYGASNMDYLLRIHEAMTGYFEREYHQFVAWDLEYVDQKLEPGEKTEVVLVDLDEAIRLVNEKEIEFDHEREAVIQVIQFFKKKELL